MSADFIYDYIPAVIETPERRIQLAALELTDDEFENFCEEYREINREDLPKYLDNYWDLAGRRDVGQIMIDGMTCWITGGMSWGCSPTEAYDIMQPIGMIYKVWELLKKWEKEDNER